MSPPSKTSCLESQLKEHAIPPPSRELRQKVLSSAKETWGREASPTDHVSWRAPILQLAASVVIGTALLYGVSRHDATLGHQAGLDRPQEPVIAQTLVSMTPSELHDMAIREQRRASTAKDYIAHAQRLRFLLGGFDEEI